MALFPFEPPTLQTVVRRVTDDLRTRLGTAASSLAHTAEAAIAGVVAGAAHPLWRAIDRAARASLWATTLDNTYLEIWASIFGVYRKQPVAASGTILVSGTPGSTVPLGTRWRRTPDAVEYKTTTAKTLVGSEVEVPVVATVTGTIGNCAVNTPVVLTGNLVGITTTAVVNNDPITSGIDLESLTSLSARFFDRLRNPPGAGKKGDYRRWALELSGITRAWEYGGDPSPGYVTIRAVKDSDDPDVQTQKLTSGEAKALYNYIRDRMPVGLGLAVPLDEAIVSLNPTIKIRPNTAAGQLAATRAVKLALSRGRIGETFPLSLINQAFNDETLLTGHEIMDPISNIALGTLEVLTIGTPVWETLPP